MTNHKLAHATFSIYSDSLVPDFWTAYFRCKPDNATIKGERFLTPSGRLSSMPGRTGVWGIRSRNAIESDTLEPHIRYLIARLEFPRPDLRTLLREKNATMRFFCYWDNYSGDRIPHVPDDIMAMMESMGGEVEIDEYPKI